MSSAEVCELARRGGPNCTIHSLRHFFRTFCTNAAIPERVLDCWLGHAPDKWRNAKRVPPFIRRNPFISHDLLQRRAWDSNPQPLAGHLISSREIVFSQYSVDLPLPVFLEDSETQSTHEFSED